MVLVLIKDIETLIISNLTSNESFVDKAVFIGNEVYHNHLYANCVVWLSKLILAGDLDNQKV